MSVSFYIHTAYLGFKWNSSMVQHYSGLCPSDLYGHIQVDCRQNVDFDQCHWIPPLADSDYPTQPIFKFSPHYEFILSVSRTIWLCSFALGHRIPLIYFFLLLPCEWLGLHACLALASVRLKNAKNCACSAG